MYRANYLQDMINMSKENVDLINVMEGQIASLASSHGHAHFKAIRSSLQDDRRVEIMNQTMLMDINCATNVFEIKKRILAKNHILKSWKCGLERWEDTQETREKVERLQEELDEKEADTVPILRYCGKKSAYQKSQDEVERLQKALTEKDAKFKTTLEVERIQMKKNFQNDTSRLQNALDEKTDENRGLLKDFRDEKARMKASLQKAQDDVARLQKAMEEKEAEHLKLLAEKSLNLEKSQEDVARLQKALDEKEHHLSSSDIVKFVLRADLQKSQNEVSRLQKVLKDKDDENQRLLNNSGIEKAPRITRNQDSEFQKDSEIRRVHEELGKLYMENQRLKDEQPVRTKPVKPLQVVLKPEQPCQNEVMMDYKPEQPSQNGVQMDSKPEQPDQHKAEQPSQNEVLMNHKPEQPTQNDLLDNEQSDDHKTEQPILHIPRSLPKTDHRTPKDFQFKNLILANRQLSVQQSDNHKTISQEDGDIDVMTEDEQSATVTQEMNALKTENKELKTKFEMINL